jgi:hypothetical protein
MDDQTIFNLCHNVDRSKLTPVFFASLLQHVAGKCDIFRLIHIPVNNLMNLLDEAKDGENINFEELNKVLYQLTSSIEALFVTTDLNAMTNWEIELAKMLGNESIAEALILHLPNENTRKIYCKFMCFVILYVEADPNLFSLMADCAETKFHIGNSFLNGISNEAPPYYYPYSEETVELLKRPPWNLSLWLMARLLVAVVNTSYPPAIQALKQDEKLKFME